MPSFYWLIADALAGSSRPGVDGHRGHGREGSGAGTRPDAVAALDRDLSWLRGQGIGAILSLTETPLTEEAIARHGLIALHLPIPDLHAPTPDQFMRSLAFIDGQRAYGRAVVAHCLMGQGRTGTILAAYRIREGRGAEEALRELRAVCPGAIGSTVQEQALHAFAARRDWIL